MTEYYGGFEVVEAAAEEVPDEEPAGPCSLCGEQAAAWIARLPRDDTVRPWALASSWRLCDPCRDSADDGRLPPVGGHGVFHELTSEQAEHLAIRLRAATFMRLR